MNTVAQAKACQICAPFLAHGVRPVFTVDPAARILVVGQAPGRRVHDSGIPWDDASGERLRDWLKVDRHRFYDPTLFAILPMGFCFPGSGKSGDLPPRPECAPQWHAPLRALMPNISLTLLIGQYAQQYYLGNLKQRNLTETVRQWQSYLPSYLPLPHPSPRNRIWLRRNPWFDQDVLPFLREHVREALAK
jgi:uracil-DNA glycosylase